MARDLLLRSWAHQCPQRHQGADGNVLVIHQLFLREWQRLHNGSRLFLGLRVDQEDDTFAIAARIPLADFPVEIELLGIATLGTLAAPPDCDGARDAAGRAAIRNGIMIFIGYPFDLV